MIFKGFRYENLYFVDFNASDAHLSICLFTKKSIMSTSKAFELLHINLFGPTQYTSIGGKNMAL
jgi:hypothetical protein